MVQISWYFLEFPLYFWCAASVGKICSFQFFFLPSCMGLRKDSWLDIILSENWSIFSAPQPNIYNSSILWLYLFFNWEENPFREKVCCQLIRFQFQIAEQTNTNTKQTKMVRKYNCLGLLQLDVYKLLCYQTGQHWGSNYQTFVFNSVKTSPSWDTRRWYNNKYVFLRSPSAGPQFIWFGPSCWSWKFRYKFITPSCVQSQQI